MNSLSIERHVVITEVPCETVRTINDAAMFHQINVSLIKLDGFGVARDCGTRIQNGKLYRVSVVGIIASQMNGGRINFFS